MVWIELNNKNRPAFDENVVVTSEELNKEENCIITSVARLQYIKEDSFGVKLVWNDLYNSGVTEPTHFCAIPPFNTQGE